MFEMKAKYWLLGWTTIVVAMMAICGYWVYKVDPYFHYHKPDLDNYFYTLNYERGQNYGIIKHFDYNAIITGSSMTENFKTSEAGKLFGYEFVKVPYSGAAYKEVNDNVKNALKQNPEIRMVIRGLDMNRFLDAWDTMGYGPAEYPSYLYNTNPFDDVEYLFNRDVAFSRVYYMLEEKEKDGFEGGISSFDDYMRWQTLSTYGISIVRPEGIVASTPKTEKHLTDEDKAIIEKNIRLNCTDVADEYPNVEFYYFYSPYSIAHWCDWKNDGKISQMLEAEELITKLIISHKNIHVFSFNNRTDIITDLNNYKDSGHYAEWVNSLMLKWMKDEKYRLTEENYRSRIKDEYEFFTSFDYLSINGQEDYEADFYAAALLNKELTGATPLNVIRSNEIDIITNNNGELVFNFDLGEIYNYFLFCCQKQEDLGEASIQILDDSNLIYNQVINCEDNEKHMYVVDLSALDRNVTVKIRGSFSTEELEVGSGYLFSDLYFY